MTKSGFLNVLLQCLVITLSVPMAEAARPETAPSGSRSARRRKMTRNVRPAGVLNGDFSRGLDGWNVPPGADHFFKREVIEQPSGNRYLKLSYTGPSYTVFVGQSIKGIKPATWYRLKCRVKVQNIKARSAGISIAWGVPMKKLGWHFAINSLSPVQLDGNSDWMQVSRLVKSFEEKECRSAYLRLFTGPPAHRGRPTSVCFDDISIEEEIIRPGSERIYRLAGSMPMERILFEKAIRGRREIILPKPLKTVNLAFRLRRPCVVYLKDSSGRKAEFLKILRSPYRIFARNGNRWQRVGNYLDNYSMSIRIDSVSGGFIIGKTGGTTILIGPFQYPEKLADFKAVGFRGLGEEGEMLAADVWLGGPLYEDVDGLVQKRRREEGGLIKTRWVEGFGWCTPEETLPKELRSPPTRPGRDIGLQSYCSIRGPLSQARGKLHFLKEAGFTILGIGAYLRGGLIGLGEGCSIGDYYRIAYRHGNADDLRAIIAEAHSLNMKVVGWLTIEHASPENPILMKHPEYIYFNAGIPRYWYPSLYYLDYRVASLWPKMADVGTYWIKNYDLDGYALESGPMCREFVRYFRSKLRQVKPDAILLGEDSRRDMSDWGLDAGWGYGFIAMVRKIFSNSNISPHAVFSEYAARFLPNQKRNHLFAIPIGGEIDLGVAEKVFGSAFTDAVIIMGTTLPGVPTSLEFNYNKKSKWLKPRLNGSWAFTSKMLKLRTAHPILAATGVIPLDAGNKNVIAYRKTSVQNTDEALVLINFSDENTEMELPIYPMLSKAISDGTIRDVVSNEDIPVVKHKNTLKITLLPYQGVVVLQE